MWIIRAPLHGDGVLAEFLQMLSDVLMKKVSIVRFLPCDEDISVHLSDTCINGPRVAGGRSCSQGYIPKSFQRSDL